MFIKKISQITLISLAVVTSSQSYSSIEKKIISEEFYYPPGFDTPQNAPEIPYKVSSPDFFKLPKEQNFGEIMAVATNSKGNVFVLSHSDTRGNLYGGSATQIFEFNKKGRFIREIGRSNLYSFGVGHGLRVDKNDDIWMVDKGTNMITRIDHKTNKPTLVLGRRAGFDKFYWENKFPKHGAPTPEGSEGKFGQPTDIAWDDEGNIYISDGYIHSRVSKFDPEGNWIGSFGKYGAHSGEFRTPHNVQIDANNHIWVADRRNGRLQVFDTEGNFIKQIIINVPTNAFQPILGHQYPPTKDVTLEAVLNLEDGHEKINLAYRPGSPDALCIPPTNKNVVFVGDLYPGRIYKLNLDGKVLGWFGNVGKAPGNTGGLHGLACPDENTIYTAEFLNWRVQKFILNPK